jgi:hypothetical protein
LEQVYHEMCLVFVVVVVGWCVSVRPACGPCLVLLMLLQFVSGYVSLWIARTLEVRCGISPHGVLIVFGDACWIVRTLAVRCGILSWFPLFVR